MTSLPTARTPSAKASGTGAVTPALPSGMSAGDIVLLVATTRNDKTCSITANGSISSWTGITGSPIQPAGGGETIYVWYGWYDSGSTGPTVTPSGDHCCAGTMAYGGVDTTNPINVQRAVDAGYVGPDVNWASSLTTTVDNCMIILTSSNGADTTTAQHSNQSAVNLANVAEVMDFETNSGYGGGFQLVSGELATAGAVGTIHWHLTTNPEYLGIICFALAPTSDVTPILYTDHLFDRMEHRWRTRTRRFVLSTEWYSIPMCDRA